MYLEKKFELDNIKGKSNSAKDIVSTALMTRENKNTKRYYVLASWCTWNRYIKNEHHWLIGFVPELTSIGVFYGK